MKGATYGTDLEDDGTNGNVDVEVVLSVISKDRVTDNGKDVVVDVASGLGGRDESGLVLEEQRVGYEVDQVWQENVFWKECSLAGATSWNML